MMQFIADGLPDTLFTVKSLTVGGILAAGIALVLKGTFRLDREYKAMEERCKEEREINAARLVDERAANEKRCDDLKQQIAEEKRKSLEATQKWEQALSNAAHLSSAATQTTKEAVQFAERLAGAVTNRGNNLPGGPT